MSSAFGWAAVGVVTTSASIATFIGTLFPQISISPTLIGVSCGLAAGVYIYHTRRKVSQ